MFLFLQGYEVEYPLPDNQIAKLILCASCALAIRGRYKTKKITKNVDFTCAMGKGSLPNVLCKKSLNKKYGNTLQIMPDTVFTQCRSNSQSKNK